MHNYRTVPAGVSNVVANVFGAQGGGKGGYGGWVQASLAVRAGQTIYILVGSSDGFNGGGDGRGLREIVGGGGSDIRTDLNDLASRLVVAGGGGGGVRTPDSDNGNGGAQKNYYY